MFLQKKKPTLIDQCEIDHSPLTLPNKNLHTFKNSTKKATTTQRENSIQCLWFSCFHLGRAENIKRAQGKNTYHRQFVLLHLWWSRDATTQKATTSSRPECFPNVPSDEESRLVPRAHSTSQSHLPSITPKWITRRNTLGASFRGAYIDNLLFVYIYDGHELCASHLSPK